jgi:hypothetical protein
MARGTIVTFYSYKGGVGRSFAMANVATILARWHFKVLCIDWDIEAPGLSYYFAPHIPAEGSGTGLVDMLAGFPDAQGPHLHWNKYTTTMHLPSVAPIDLISAGQRDENYTVRVQALNCHWASFGRTRDAAAHRASQCRRGGAKTLRANSLLHSSSNAASGGFLAARTFCVIFS